MTTAMLKPAQPAALTAPTLDDFYVIPISDTDADGESDILWGFDGIADDFGIGSHEGRAPSSRNAPRTCSIGIPSTVN